MCLAADTVYVVDKICVVDTVCVAVYTLPDAGVMRSKVLADVLQVGMQLSERTQGGCGLGCVVSPWLPRVDPKLFRSSAFCSPAPRKAPAGHCSVVMFSYRWRCVGGQLLLSFRICLEPQRSTREHFVLGDNRRSGKLEVVHRDQTSFERAGCFYLPPGLHAGSAPQTRNRLNLPGAEMQALNRDSVQRTILLLMCSDVFCPECLNVLNIPHSTCNLCTYTQYTYLKYMYV